MIALSYQNDTCLNFVSAHTLFPTVYQTINSLRIARCNLKPVFTRTTKIRRELTRVISAEMLKRRWSGVVYVTFCQCQSESFFSVEQMEWRTTHPYEEMRGELVQTIALSSCGVFVCVFVCV